MSIDYTNLRFHATAISAASANDIILRLWSKTKQWRVIGFDAMTRVAPATGQSAKLRNITTSTDLVTQDFATDAALTQYEVRVAAGANQLVNPGAIVHLIALETDGTGVIDVVVIATDTTS